MIYPIRVDATSIDQSYRLVDTLLVDTTCLPVPPSFALSPPSSKRRRTNAAADTLSLLEQTALENASYFAATLIADLEVSSGLPSTSAPSRGANNKSTRMRLLSRSGLRELVEDQIRAQLRIVLKRDQMDECAVVSNSGVETNESKDIEEPKGTEIEDLSSSSSLRPNPNLRPVRIRLRTPSITVLDEFSVDPFHAHSSPLFLAQSLASDLSLPPDSVDPLAITIAEQAAGLEVDGDLEGVWVDNGGSSDTIENGSINIDNDYTEDRMVRMAMAGKRRRKAERSIPTAWGMDEKEEGIAQSYYAASSGV